MFGINWFNQELAIDLGTANTLIIHNNEIVIDEPSIIAIDEDSDKIIAIGSDAVKMEGRTHEKMKTIRPLKDGVIANFEAAEYLIRGLIKKVSKQKKWLFPSLRMVVCVPTGVTEVEQRAVRDSAEMSGAREVYLIDEPMAAAIGIGLDVQGHDGNMIVDIGGGTTEIAVIALSGIIGKQSLRVAGDTFDNDIINYLRRQHGIIIGSRTAEKLKISAGAAITKLDEEVPDVAIQGKNAITGIPTTLNVSSAEIAHCLNESIQKLELAIDNVLEKTPPELASDIYHRGIYLTGGGSLLRGLDKRLSEKTRLPIHVGEDPLRAVVRGTGIVLNHLEKYKFIMR